MRGEVRLIPFDEADELPPELETLWLVPPAGAPKPAGGQAPQPRKLMAARPGPGAWLVLLEGVTTREAARELTGLEAWVSMDELPALEPGEFYLHELTGKEARDEQGQKLGTVLRVESLRGQDLLTLRTPRGQRMVPIVEGTVAELDRRANTVVLVVPEGLLE